MITAALVVTSVTPGTQTAGTHVITAKNRGCVSAHHDRGGVDQTL